MQLCGGHTILMVFIQVTDSEPTNHCVKQLKIIIKHQHPEKNRRTLVPNMLIYVFLAEVNFCQIILHKLNLFIIIYERTF